MRIDRILLKNYRQFRELDLRLRGGPSDLHIFLGRNGTGKTNILNAINWCLYNDEPHLSNNSKALPLLNLKSTKMIGSRDVLDVVAEIWASANGKSSVAFARRVSFRVVDGSPTPQRREFEVRTLDDAGNTKVYEGDRADALVERFMPRSLRGFFLFDGERLDNYFRSETGLRIRNSVFEMSQIGVLKRIEERLGDAVKDLRRVAGQASPSVDAARRELENAEELVRDTEKRMEETRRQIAQAKDEIRDAEMCLRGTPDVEDLERRRDGLLSQNRDRNRLIEEKRNEIREVLFQQHKVLAAMSAIQATLSTIQAMQEKGEIPPSVDPDLLKEVLRADNCKVCGRDLDSHCVEHVKRLLSRHNLSSRLGSRLLSMRYPLHAYTASPRTGQARARSLHREIDAHAKESEQNDRETDRIDSQLQQYDVQSVKELHRKRAAFERARDQKQMELGALDAEKPIKQAREKEALARYDAEQRKEKKAKELSEQVALGTRALATISAVREQIMAETRGRVVGSTNKYFLSLVWKRSTFQEVKIDEDYNMNVIHADGYECMGSLSAAETELLALSFILALHDVSGFSSPLLLDTPVARVSDAQRESFARVLAELSKTKQTILLFTPAEYSSELSHVMDGVGMKHQLTLSLDESTTEVEEI